MKAVFALIIALCAAAPAFSQEMKHEHMSEHAKHVMGEGGKQSEHTLMKVMHDLAFQLSRIQFGLLTNNRLMIEEGAKGVANHPAPKGGLAPYIKKNKEAIKSVVPEMDKKVHKTALKMAEGAATLNMIELQGLANTMTEGCVGCHDIFRD
ncbi:MAG: hypothetical protein HZB29_12585 [Nitrospinae bacterium]|nr:hypothetical protein [Nitrospinota bacterium]